MKLIIHERNTTGKKSLRPLTGPTALKQVASERHQLTESLFGPSRGRPR